MPSVDSPPVLQFESVRGVSAVSSAQFSVVGDTIAYIASGGVVVSTFDSHGKTLGQRFFVANVSTDVTKSINMFGDFPPDADTYRDHYGYAKNSTVVWVNPRSDTDKGTLVDHKEGLKIKDRLRNVSCVALSPNKRVLAVGETGYLPRILLYSLAPNSSHQPFAVLQEHSFGVKHISFAPDLKHFCSLGDPSDGFLYVWRYSASSVALRSANKCTSIVNDIAWHDSDASFYSIITVGLRFMKVWTFEPLDSLQSSKVCALSGRNVVLGSYLDYNFQEVLQMNESDALVKSGCIIFVLSNLCELVPVHESPSAIAGFVLDDETEDLVLFDLLSNKSHVALDLLEQINIKSLPPSPTKLAARINNIAISDDTLLKAYRTGSGIVLLNSRRIDYIPPGLQEAKPLVTSTGSISYGRFSSSSECLVFAKDGRVSIIDESGDMTPLYSFSLPLGEHISNELTSVDKVGSQLCLGDKFGLLTFVDLDHEKIDLQLKAHASTVSGIQYLELDGSQFLCSISRDRMIQIFHKSENGWELMRTLPTHSGKLVGVKTFGSSLFVCSADRSVSVHEVTKDDGQFTVVQRKIITLKSTPLFMDLFDGELVVSCNDKYIYVYDASKLALKRSLKLCDEKSGDSLCVEKFSLLPDANIAIASSDKSLRVFNMLTGKHVHLTWGHFESVLAMFAKDSHLFTLGLEGCLFKWALRPEIQSQAPSPVNSSSMSFVEPDSISLHGKVARKIMPVAVPSASSSPSKLTSPVRPQTAKANDEVLADPDSPTPRLSSATLKRLEAKRKLAETSPIKTAPFKASTSPFKGSLASTSPFKSSTPPSPSRQSRPSSPAKSVATSQVVRRAASVKSLTPSLPPSGSDAHERALAYLTIIRSHISKDLFTEHQKLMLRDEVLQILNLLGGTPTSHSDELLDKYSTKLVELVEQKLKDSAQSGDR